MPTKIVRALPVEIVIPGNARTIAKRQLETNHQSARNIKHQVLFEIWKTTLEEPEVCVKGQNKQTLKMEVEGEKVDQSEGQSPYHKDTTIPTTLVDELLQRCQPLLQ